MMVMAGVGHDESGRLVPTGDFDFEAVDRDLFGECARAEIGELSQAEVDAAVKLFRTLLEWVWQCGMKNADGIQIRAILVCWIFLEELKPLTLTGLAKGFGKHKQSLGRWHDDFKRAFPQIKTPHMRPPKK